MTRALKEKYNSSILCVSSLVYFLVGFIPIYLKIGIQPFFLFYVFFKQIHKFFFLAINLAILLFTVTLFSVLYHNNFKDFNLKVLDWTFGAILFLYLLYIVNIEFDLYIFTLIASLVAFKILDHVIFKARRYGVFNYTHSLWHFLSGVAVVLVIIFT